MFRYERSVAVRTPAPIVVVADAAMLAHTRPELRDLRVTDARGNEVPWRFRPEQQPADRPVALVDAGRRGSVAVARFRNPGRLGGELVLEVPDARFTGSVTVLGSDDRSTWTTLSTTEIYSVGGAAPARSTTALVPTTTYRWIELRATGVTRIEGARHIVRGGLARLARIPGRLRGTVLDLRYPVPVEALRLSAAAARYSRPFRVLARGRVVASGRLARTGGRGTTFVPVVVRARRLRIVIENGDDPPLRGLRAEAFARERAIVVEGGNDGPLTLYYGGDVAAPDYEFARLPFDGPATRAALGPERRNPRFRVVDARGFFERHRSLVTVALALAAAAVLAAGTLALRRT